MAAVVTGVTVGVAEAGILLGGGSLAGTLVSQWFHDTRVAKQDRRAIFKERDEVNEQIAQLEERGPPRAEGPHRQAQLADLMERRGYLNSELAGLEVLAIAPRGPLQIRSEPVQSLTHTVVRLRRLLEESRTATALLDAQGWFLRGNAHYEAGNYDDALAAYDRALQSRPNDPDSHYNRGLALGGLGRHEEALAAYDRALQLRPDDAGAHNNRGAELADLGRHEEALAAYDRALQLRPNDAGAHKNRGSALTRLGRYDEALVAFDRALQVRPADPATYNNRGVALGHLGRYEEALAACDRALQLRPDDAVSHYNRGATLVDLGRHEEALAAYDRALQLGPDHAGSHYNRSCTLSRLGRFPESFAALERAIEAGFRNFELAESDDDLAPLRDHPQYGPKFRELIDHFKNQ